MFRDELLDELGRIFGETIVEHESGMSNTAESVYITYGDVDIDVADDKEIKFEVPFSLTIYTDRNDFAFGFLTLKFSSYKPNRGESKISAVDNLERPFWDGGQSLGVTKNFVFEYSTEYNVQTEKLREIEFK
ncbi:hypothetical protein P7245_22380 [Vibrio parahaemolyticus]|nr:hypothetical protein [Vibrio parahaemolyticus]